jgi:hypothetical protein
MRRPALLLGIALIPSLLLAQKPAPSAKAEVMVPLPAGWTARPDEGGKLREVRMENMAPGWHITMATSAIFYREADKATGNYEFAAKLHLFPEATGHREALGIFVGGQDLKGAGQRYTYFVIRGDGTWKIKRRNGAATSDVTPGWTASPAIVKGKPDGSVANVLTVTVKGGKASFGVNGTEVYSAAASTLDVDGTPGLRINHGLAVHVESIGIKPL